MQTPRLKLDNKILNISNDLSPLLFIGHKEETVSKFTVPEYDVIFDKISNIEIGVSRVFSPALCKREQGIFHVVQRVTFVLK